MATCTSERAEARCARVAIQVLEESLGGGELLVRAKLHAQSKGRLRANGLAQPQILVHRGPILSGAISARLQPSGHSVTKGLPWRLVCLRPRVGFK